MHMAAVMHMVDVI